MTRTDPMAPHPSVTVIALVIAAASFMLLLDGAIINTSLPQIGRDLRVSAVDMNLGITAYILAVAVFTPLSAWAADRVGPKQVFTAAIALFTLASIGCAMAETLPQFILARVAQGLGGAMIFPVGRAIVLRAAHASQLMQATAVLTWPALFAPVIGPVIGGGITSFVGWRWNFLLNVPLGLIGIVLAVAILPAGERAQRRPLDWVGALLTAAALFLLIYGLGALGDRHSLARPIVLLIVGGAIGAADLLWLARARHPLLDLGSLKVPTFALSTVTAGNFCLIAVSAAPFLIPLMMQEAWGLSPLQAGGWVLFYFLGNLLAKTRTTATLRRFGFRPVMVLAGLGIGVTVCACGLLAPASPTIVIVALLFAAGATRSMQLTAINTLAFSDVPQDRRAASSTLSAMIQQVSMALGVAIAAVAINLARGVHGAAQPGQGDFRIAFLVCGMIGAAGGLICLRLPRDAGAEVSGYVPRNARRNEVTI